ncbi:MAG: hypothetical protein NTZ67_01135 [Gammaproteobacteria bacterium]|nr:hypothetical protein [Gammaproteobacteria bacterium]
MKKFMLGLVLFSVAVSSGYACEKYRIAYTGINRYEIDYTKSSGTLEKLQVMNGAELHPESHNLKIVSATSPSPISCHFTIMAGTVATYPVTRCPKIALHHCTLVIQDSAAALTAKNHHKKHLAHVNFHPRKQS